MIALNKQCQIYSLETDCFYDEREQEINYELGRLRNNAFYLKKATTIAQRYKNNGLKKSDAIKEIYKLYRYNMRVRMIDSKDYIPKSEDDMILDILNGKSGEKIEEEEMAPIDVLRIGQGDIIGRLKAEYKENNKKIEETKKNLKETIKSNKKIRELNDIYLRNSNVVSLFDSSLTRTLGMSVGALSEALMIVRVFYFDVAESLAVNGFMLGEERYVYLSSSAGQIRTKKMVFIKESLWNQHKNSIMCGLSIEKINSKGGVNGNKFLAYLALCSSATDEWTDFDITKCIVVDDLETKVTGEVDFFDDKTYEITRKIMDVPINHTDGCGMCLPRVSAKAKMIRLPWVKGLLVPFDFQEFIFEHNGSSKITDIYGKEYDIFEDDIQIIFTKSQFKLHKQYDDWQNYINNYIKFGCSAGYCNEEQDDIPYAKINYQMLQTLTDVTDDEIENLASQTNYMINNIASDTETAMKVLGASKITDKNSYLSQMVSLYPQIIQDNYIKEKLKLVKASMVKNAKSGKLNLNAKYAFIIPDLYAFCEKLFIGHENPRGLLADGEVFCSLFKKSKELDCLRSPQLYREHPIRNNVYDSDRAKWFITNGLYVSCHDLISKLIMNDWDGDTSLVCADETLLTVVKRNMQGVVPLYYEMAVAPAATINSDTIFKGLLRSFTSGKIGETSNAITKIWNGEDVDLEVIKILSAESNYKIDSAKSLYEPVRPKEVDRRIRSLTKLKVPHFFMFVKDKSKSQVDKINGSTVNRICRKINNGRMRFEIKGPKFDYHMLMKNPYTEIDDDKWSICEVYDLFKGNTYNGSANTEKAIEKRTAIFRDKREKFEKYFGDLSFVADVLVKYLFKDGCNSKYKDVLFYSLGDVLIENLKNNMEKSGVK